MALGSLWADTPGGELADDDLVHQGDVRRYAEVRRVERHPREDVAVPRLTVDRQGGIHFFCCDRRHACLPPFTASRMTTREPRGPGTAPLTRISSRSASASTISRLSAVPRS